MKLIVLFLCLLCTASHGAVVLNEIFTSPSERQLTWNSNGVPKLGSGTVWYEEDFQDLKWASGNLPAGYGFGGLGTDLTSVMRNKTPSLYIRKEFHLSDVQAALTDPLTLSVDYNDGFIAFLNGKEIARANMGATNRFVYASQPAYNVSTSATFAVFTVGPANLFVRPGRNVLSIQAANAEQPSTASIPEHIVKHLPTPEFKINAALRVSGNYFTARPVTVTFDGASGGSRIHQNSGGTITSRIEGEFTSGGWLSLSPPPITSGAWENITITETELASGGLGNSSAYSVTIAQEGTNHAATVFGPLVNMSGSWEPGNVATNDLQGTILRFRYRGTPGTQFRFRVDPETGGQAGALTGFPLVTGATDTVVNFANANNGARIGTVNSNGTLSQTQQGTLRSLSLFGFASNDMAGLSFRLLEDATNGLGYNNSTGHLRAEVRQLPSNSGSGWGFNYGGLQVPTWTLGNVSTQEFEAVSVQLAVKLPAGQNCELWAEPAVGGYRARVDWGTLQGNGDWQLITRDFATAPGAETFRLAQSAARSRTFKIFFKATTTVETGTWIQVDDIQIMPWREYLVNLGSGTGPKTNFLNALNSASGISFIPAFEKVSNASTAPQTLFIDNFEVLFTGRDAMNVTNFIFSGAPWKYHVGTYEPSGGVVDPGLVTNVFLPPASDQDDFEEPERFVDWVELKNEGGSDIDIGGWSLTDEADTPAKWRLPAGTIIPAGGFLLVLCDDREEANSPNGPAEFLHAAFTLSSDGEYLALFDDSGAYVDGLTNAYPKQVHFASFGRAPETNHWAFLTKATPGSENAGEALIKRVDSPEFKQLDGTNELAGGIYTTNRLFLVLTNKTPGSIIRYTLNGSEPTEWNGTIFSNTLAITQPNEKSATVIKARAFLDGWLPSGVKTYTYILRQPAALTNVPAIMLSAQKERAFYKPFGVLAIQGGFYQAVSSGEIWMQNSPQSYNEVLGSGFPFEREVHLEYYFPPGYYPTNQEPIRGDVGLRISASPYQRPRMKLQNVEVNSPWSPYWDATEKPSFNMFFVGDYGMSELDYRLFPDYTVKNFQNLRLRAGKNDNGNPWITDELVRRMFHEMGHVSPRGLFASLWLNGIYRGIYNMTERIREPFFQNHYRTSGDWDVRYSGEWVNGDTVAWTTMRSTLDRDLTQLSNYVAATELVEVENFIDYYLLNIYCAMWDWPENNFVLARERSTGPLGKWRFTVWDAEGAFNVQSYYNKPVTFDTVNELNTKNVDIANIWKRLYLNPEFKLAFADRVARHMFNGGVLDDRDLDGTGAYQPIFWREFDKIAAHAAPLVRYNHGSPLFTNLFSSWTAGGTGRRSYLLGSGAGREMLRSAGLWPATEMPMFSQHGGSVGIGYELTMTNFISTAGQTAEIYYTTDGTDPRVFGSGTLAANALTYEAPLVITNIVTVKARARNNQTGQWSPLTEATFAPDPMPASPENLVVAEIMYNPQAPGTNELANGFTDSDDFEFMRLLNIGDKAISLGELRLVTGVTFDFASSPVRYLNPGASLLVVKNKLAFRTRYGATLDGRIAGEYTGNLSNGGERLALLNDTNIVKEFAYNNSGAWPASADGDGPSLLLVNPFSNPDHAQATNWVASAMPGGMPGGSAAPVSFDRWRELFWGANSFTNATISGPEGDPDADGLPNFAEYALGLNPMRTQPTRSKMHLSFETVGTENFLTLEYLRSATGYGYSLVLQSSSNLVNWADITEDLETLSAEETLEGTVRFKQRRRTPLSPSGREFLRMQIVREN